MQEKQIFRKKVSGDDPLTFCDNAQTEGMSWGAIRAVVSSLCCIICTKMYLY